MKAVITSLFVSLSVILLVFMNSCKEEIYKQPENLFVEYRKNPKGIGRVAPRFSWQLNDSVRGAKQTAYQILVADSKKAIKNCEGNVWNSQKMNSNQSVHVAYRGNELEPGKTYFWKVRTWDADGKPSSYSKAATFGTALESPKGWKANWITSKAQKKSDKKDIELERGNWIWFPSEKRLNSPVFFRKEIDFNVEKQIEKVIINASADNMFTLYFNGEKVGEGNDWQRLHSFNVTESVKENKNLIAAKAVHTQPEHCGFICDITIFFEDGSYKQYFSDNTWKTMNYKKTGWEKPGFNEAGMQQAEIVAEYGDGYWADVFKTLLSDPPASFLLRNEFIITKNIRSAKVYVSGLGSYVLRCNGQKVGNDLLTPGWTDYHTKVQYQIYDITPLLKIGKNAFGAILGNVWWSSGLGWSGGKTYSNGPLRFILQAHINYDDGTTDTLTTNREWKTGESPVVENRLYDGEKYDARLEQEGWDQPDFSDKNWEPAVYVNTDEIKLVSQQCETIRIRETLKARSIDKPADGIYVFDYGQNMAGRTRLKVNGPAGTKITLKFAELLHHDGTVALENLRSAKATDTYTLKGDSTEEWAPAFTYHGFRYVEVHGLPHEPDSSTLIAEFFNTAVAETGSFDCSNKVMDSFQKNIKWGALSNFMSVPTDCPQRDERLGWMGDAQIFTPTACYNFQMAGFLTKWQRDILDCQHPTGYVYDVNPQIVVTGPAKPGWGDAVVIVPWVVYQFYGDTAILKESYDGMKAWVEYMNSKSKDYIYEWGDEEWGGYGDWVAVEKTPSKPIGCAYFYYSSKLLGKIAEILGKNADATQYSELADHIADAYQKKYFDTDSMNYEGSTQTANLLPLAFGITPDSLKNVVVNNIVEDVKEHDNHLTTGFLGTAYLLPILSQYGFHDLAYEVATQTTYPSWGYMLENGATTIWELWNSDKEPPEKMNSRNHFAYGSVGEWYYGYIAGIMPDVAHPGFKKSIIAPRPVSDLQTAKAKLNTCYGMLSCKWENNENGLIMNVIIPANTSAKIIFPMVNNARTITESSTELYHDKPIVDNETFTFVSKGEKTVEYEIGAGNYQFVVK